MINTLKIAVLIMAIYIFLESLCAICKMPEGWRLFCHKVKYVLAFSSSIVYMWALLCLQFPANTSYKAQMLVWYIIAGSALTILFFIWPRTVWRIKNWWSNFSAKIDEVLEALAP